MTGRYKIWQDEGDLEEAKYDAYDIRLGVIHICEEDINLQMLGKSIYIQRPDDSLSATPLLRLASSQMWQVQRHAGPPSAALRNCPFFLSNCRERSGFQKRKFDVAVDHFVATWLVPASSKGMHIYPLLVRA